ncbi:hypothetical protein PMIN06_009061 [Paraphaeosphaeria minitans]
MGFPASNSTPKPTPKPSPTSPLSTMITSMTWQPPDISYDMPVATSTCDPVMRVQCKIDADLRGKSSDGNWNGCGVPSSYVVSNIEPRDVASVFRTVSWGNY